MRGRVLIVDDDAQMCELLADDLTARGLEVIWDTDAERAFERFMAEPFELVLTDLKMPGLDGIGFCDRLSKNRPDVPVVVITGFGSMQTAVQAIRAGAYDFVTKPIELEHLALTLERGLSHRALRERVRRLELQGPPAPRGGFVGDSEPMRRLFEQVQRLAGRDIPILITGESGTGKELIAQSLHDQSPRRDGPFVPINCAALPEALLESELFGHASGAFTDARGPRQGLFAQADGGTLLLDEIGEMPITLQPKILRALETGKARPVGGDTEQAFDVRILAATNRDLAQEAREGRFREDLYYRINVVQLHAPPLRERANDPLLLAQHFLQRISERGQKTAERISPDAARRLLNYPWPGNVRELRNAIERAAALTRTDQLLVDDLPEALQQTPPASEHVATDADNADAPLLTLEQLEKQHIQHVLDRFDGNKTRAAQALGLDRTTLHRKIERWADETAPLNDDADA